MHAGERRSKRKSREITMQKRKPAIKRKYRRGTRKAQVYLDDIIEGKIKRGRNRWVSEKMSQERGKDFQQE